MAVQWVHLGADEVLLASERGAWIHRAQPGTLMPAGPMPDAWPGTPATTRQLLDGSIAAAERHRPTRLAPPPSARRWAWNLASQWHCAHHSVALLPGLAERYEAIGRADLAGFARGKLEQEAGHDRFSLADLRALGYDAEALVSRVGPGPAVAAALHHARACASGERPVDFLGYVYALERRVLRLGGDWLRAWTAVLPSGIEAASGVRAHAAGLDPGHVDDALAFFAGLPGGDRTRIAISCHRVTGVLCGPLATEHPSAGELEALLAPFEHDPASVNAPYGAREQGASP